MGTKSWSNAWFPDDGDAFDLSAIAEHMQDSVDPGLKQRFTSTSARDAWLAASDLTSTEKRGALAYVDGVGLTYYTGSQWRRVSAHGENFVQSGVTPVDCEATGLAAINFPVAFGGKPNVTATRYTSVYGVEGLTVAINDSPGIAVTATYFHVYVTKRSTTAPYGDVPYDSWVHISWMAHGPRTTD